jgi:hypothetical protein
MMNPRSDALRWVMVTQLASLIGLLAVPLLVRYLNSIWGKILYAGLALLLTVFAVKLWRLLAGADEAK